jgi:hypothetical protein
MSAPTLAELLDDLVDRGHLDAAQRGEVAELAGAISDERLDPTPWYLRALVGGGAWIATLFFLGCAGLLLGSAFDEGPALILGVLLTLGSGVMRQAQPRAGRDALHQSALALGLTGRALFAFGLSEIAEGEVVPGLFLLAYEGVVLALWRDPVQRWFATISAVGALFIMLADGIEPGDAGRLLLLFVWPAACVAHVAHDVAVLSRWQPLLRPVAWGLTAATLGLLLFWSVGSEVRSWVWVPGLALCAAALHLGLLAWQRSELPSAPQLPPGALILFGVALAVLLPAGPIAPGLLVGVSLAVTGTATRQGLLVATAAATFGASLVWLYWQFDVAFSLKAASMLAPAVIILALRPLLRRMEAS